MNDPSYRVHPFDYDALPLVVPVRRQRQRLWLHLLLFAATVVTTLAVGAQLTYNFSHGLPAFDLNRSLNPFSVVWGHPERLWWGLPFSMALLGILLAHEMGHYLACRYYGIAVSYPYFIPAPTIIGTLGAFLRIRQPIRSRRVLFDVGVAGPLAGFVVALPLLIAGMAVSRADALVNEPGVVSFGSPLLVRFVEALFFPGVPAASIELHPVARAAWVGLFATALNLLPIGQLDGGHILYSLIGDVHRKLSRVFAAMLLPLGYFLWPGWLLWAVLMLILGTRHPVLFDPRPLDSGRRWLGALALVIFLLCFTPAPFTATTE